MNSLVGLGSLLKKKRSSLKISLKKLALKCGMSDSTISLIERGKAKAPSILQVLNVAAALNIQPTELFEALDYKIENKVNSVCSFQNVASLTNEEVRTVQAFIDFLVSRKAAEEKGDAKQ